MGIQTSPSWVKKMVVVVVVVVVMMVIQSTSGASALRFKRQHDSVNILNATPGGGGDLVVHCASRDDDLGVKVVKGGQWYGWGFEANVLGTTLYSCNFAWGDRTQGFVVWQDIGIWGNQPRPCRHCVWVVRTDGFYRSENQVEGPSVKVYNWN